MITKKGSGYCISPVGRDLKDRLKQIMFVDLDHSSSEMDRK